jgi:hypothetical protein
VVVRVVGVVVVGAVTVSISEPHVLMDDALRGSPVSVYDACQ